MNAPQDDFDSVKKRLGAIGQEHVLSFWPALSDRERAPLLADIGHASGFFWTEGVFSD